MIDDLPDNLSPAEALAMEWALGTLDRKARTDADARRASDPAFAALCDDWAEQLSLLADEVAPVAPSAALWAKIDAEIGKEAGLQQSVAVAPAASPWWARLAVWQGATAAFASLALALLITRPPAPLPPAPLPPAPPIAAPQTTLLAATLSAEGGRALVTASLDTGRSSVVVSPVAGEDLNGRVPELWLIPADGKPRSLGLISLGGVQQVAVSPTLLKLVAEGAVLAVSLEPAGGSPTGLPTGPVVATGKLTTL